MSQDLWAETHEPLEMLDLIREPLPHASDQQRERHSELLDTYTRSFSFPSHATAWRERHYELLNTYTVRSLIGIGADTEADLFREHAFGFTGNDSDEMIWARENLEAQAGQRDCDTWGQQWCFRPRLYAQRARAALAAINALHTHDASGSPWLAAVAVTQETRHLIQREQCGWLRCLFPHPAGSASVERPWLTTTVLQLARGINQESAFDRLPILADALQDAGCDNENLLRHCRHAAVHGPHCWALAAVLASDPVSHRAG